MKFSQFITLIVGAVLGITLAALTIGYVQFTKEPVEPSPARLELSVGGNVQYYQIPTDQVIHVIADKDGNGLSIQLIPDILPSKSAATTNGQQTNTSVAGNVP